MNFGLIALPFIVFFLALNVDTTEAVREISHGCAVPMSSTLETSMWDIKITFHCPEVTPEFQKAELPKSVLKSALE